MNQSPVLLHVWSVQPEDEATLVKQLGEMLAHVSDDPAFVSGRILASEDRTSIAAVIEMQSSEARQRLEERPEVHETLDHTQGAYNLVIRLYHEVEAYGDARKGTAA